MDPQEFNRLALGRPKFASVDEFAVRATELLQMSQAELHAVADASGNPRRSADGVVLACRQALRLLDEMRAKGVTVARSSLGQVKAQCNPLGQHPDGPVWAGAMILLADVRFPKA